MGVQPNSLSSSDYRFLYGGSTPPSMEANWSRSQTLISSPVSTHGMASGTLLLWYCQLWVINLLPFNVWQHQQNGALSTQSTQPAACLLLLCLANSAARSPYVFYEGHQAAAVSPQSVGREASSAPLRCCANPVWPRAALVGCSEERSRCTRRRCRWGSEDIRDTNTGQHKHFRTG